MQTVISWLRTVLGTTDGFYTSSGGSYSSYYWNYGLIIEYIVGACIILVVISQIFKLLRLLFGGSN